MIKKNLINRVLKEYLLKESLVEGDSLYQNEINQINSLSETDSDLENRFDKIWNSLEIKTKQNGSDMSKFNSSVNEKIKMFVDKLSQKSKNPAVWGRRKVICDLWK